MRENKVSFEEGIQRLEQIVRTMEQGEISLEESLKLFNEGTALVQSCGKLLDEAELQIKIIVPDENGLPVEEDFICEP